MDMKLHNKVPWLIAYENCFMMTAEDGDISISLQ